VFGLVGRSVCLSPFADINLATHDHFFLVVHSINVHYFYDPVYPNRHNGRWHGKGRALYSNGDTYEGEYKLGLSHGRGVWKWEAGEVYDGMLKNNKMHGLGVYKTIDGAVYDGMFREDELHGSVRSYLSFCFRWSFHETIEKHLPTVFLLGAFGAKDGWSCAF
jgi:hypothetical protein